MSLQFPARERTFTAYNGSLARPLVWVREFDGRKLLVGITENQREVFIDTRHMPGKVVRELRQTVRHEPIRWPLYFEKIQEEKE